MQKLPTKKASFVPCPTVSTFPPNQWNKYIPVGSKNVCQLLTNSKVKNNTMDHKNLKLIQENELKILQDSNNYPYYIYTYMKQNKDPNMRCAIVFIHRV